MNKKICRCFCMILAFVLVLSCAACVKPVVPTQTVSTNPPSTQPPSTQPTVTNPTPPTQLPVPNGATICAGEVTYYAPYVGVGSHALVLEEGMNYVLFVPIEAGEYRICVDSPYVLIGYYGRADFVHQESLAEADDNAVTVTVRDGMISKDDPNSSAFVIGIRSNVAQLSCMIQIERIGDPAWDVSEEPWIVYEPTVELKEYSVPEGVSLEKFDLTASAEAYELVFNEVDRFYHLGSADGPLVLVYLTKRTAYLDELFTVARLSNLCCYFYDAGGNFTKRETYSQCVLTYAQYVDKATGVYPLTEDLKYMIQGHGGFTGWWDMDDPYNCIFRDVDGNVMEGINPELAWLFMCCYLSQ